VLIALAILGLDVALGGGSDARRVILVDDAVRGELVALFRAAEGREPTADDLNQAVDRWVQGEVVYREALALGLDKGDEVIRERLVTKMRTLLRENVVVDPPTDAALAAWFEANRRYYDLPQRYDIEQFLVPAGGAAEATARRLATELGTGGAPAAYADLVRSYAARPEANVAGMFGDAFAAALAAAPTGRWQALASPAGWHVARVTAVSPAEPAQLADVHDRVVAEWRTVESRRQVAEQLFAIRDNYDVRVVPPGPARLAARP
jgi:hypothetical protein